MQINLNINNFPSKTFPLFSFRGSCPLPILLIKCDSISNVQPYVTSSFITAVVDSRINTLLTSVIMLIESIKYTGKQNTLCTRNRTLNVIDS